MEIMNTTTINKQKIDFSITDEKVFTTSLDIAKVFEKRHDNVIRDIENLPKDKFHLLNFEEIERISQTTNLKNVKVAAERKYKYYNISRDGFALLAMGFTGEKAYKWKIAYINAFNAMEKQIRQNSLSLESLKGLFEFMGTDNRIGGSLLWSMSDTVSNKEVEGFKELVIPRNAGSFTFYQTAREKEILENTTTYQEEFQKAISDKEKLETELEIARAEIDVYKAKERLYELKLKGRKE